MPKEKRNTVVYAGVWTAMLVGAIPLLKDNDWTIFMSIGDYLGDWKVFMSWYLYLMLIGIISIPLTKAVLPGIRGFTIFSKLFGVLIPGFMMWFADVIFHLPFNIYSCFVMIVIYTGLNVVIAARSKNAKEALAGMSIRKVSSGCCKYELIFLGMFIFWVYLVGFNPSAYGTEKFMDYGFLQKMLVSTQLPPDDLWYAGNSINYYYGGQYYAAYIAKTMLFGPTKAEYAYNMMRALISAFTFAGVFVIAEQMILDKTGNKRTGNIFATLSAAVTVFAGNGHYLVYRIIKPIFSLGGDNQSYWFPDSTRYIGYNPVVENDQTIHEFPCYSFVLGDLHAHMVNIIFVLLLLAVLYSFVKARKEKEKILYAQLFVAGLIWGIYNWTNYWDFIIYIVVIAIVIIFANLSCAGIKRTAAVSAAQIAVVVVTGLIAALPFTLNFKSVFDGVGIAEHHTPLYQLAILWGIPAVLSAVFIVSVIAKVVKDKAVKNICSSDMFAFILSCCAIGLVLIPEIVYVRDIYEATHARANTMFKLTYQSFIMFGLCSGYIIAVLLDSQKKAAGIFACVMAALNILTIGYFFNAANSWFPDWTSPDERTGLYALSYLVGEDFTEEKMALVWTKEMSETGKMTGVIAEAPGDSYTACERVSVISGLSTVAGWQVHEWLWRDDYDGIHRRTEDINSLYLNKNSAEEIIEKYGIDYIYFGKQELIKYGEESKDRVKKYGNVIYDDDYAVVVDVRGKG